MRLTIYRSESETVSRVSGCIRDGDGDARAFYHDCSGCAGGRNCCSRRADEGACKGRCPANQPSGSGAARVRGPGRCARIDGPSQFVPSETAPRRPRHDLPLRRSDRRAALGTFVMPAKAGIHLSDVKRGAPTWTPASAGVTAVTSRRCSASRESPEFRHLQPRRTPTNRMGATCSDRPSALAATAGAR